jgi:hypothetical protein
MLSVRPVIEDHTRLNKARPELRTNMNDPIDATRPTPSSNPPIIASKTEDRPRSIPQDYHQCGADTLSAAVDAGLEGWLRKNFPHRILRTGSIIYCSWNFDSSAIPD